MARKDSSRIKRWLPAVGLAALLTMLTAIGCSQPGLSGGEPQTSQAETIKIGIFEPLTGALAEPAKPEIEGMELAHKLYPTVKGKTIELIRSDNRSDVAAAPAAARKLVEHSVVAVIGSYGNLISIAGGEVFSEAAIPAVAVTCTNPLVTAGNPYYFRVCPVDSFQGVMAAKYVVNELKLKQAVVMKALGDDYSTALSGKFAEKLIQLTGDSAAVAQTVEYKAGAQDFHEPLAAIQASGAKAVYLTGDVEDSATIITQAKRAGLEFRFIGTARWHTEEMLKLAGHAGESLVFTSFSESGQVLTEKAGLFKKAWEQAHGVEDGPPLAAALGFDAYLMIYQALEKQGAPATDGKLTRAPLRDLIRDSKDFQGATGSIQFDQNGDPVKPVVFMTIQNGEFTYRYTAVPEWGSG